MNNLTIRTITVNKESVTEHTQLFSFKDKEDLERQFKSREVNSKHTKFVLNNLSFTKIGKRVRTTLFSKGSFVEVNIYTLQVY